jgi:hypothetical protein
MTDQDESQRSGLGSVLLRVLTADIGTFEKWSDVRNLVVIGGKANVEPMYRKRRGLIHFRF